MNKKIFSISALMLLTFSMVLINPVESKSLISNLLEIDVFHAPEEGDPTAPFYKEWHYFNIIDEEQGLSYITTFMLNGDVSSSTMSAAINLVSYRTPDGGKVKMDGYPIWEANWSNESPNVTINNSSVYLDEEGYHVYTESADGTTVFDALFKPEIVPTGVFNVPLPDVGYGVDMNWLSTSPKMNVNGTLTINKGTLEEKTYILENVRGYHDHNWGRWLWSDDMGWDWAQASEANNPQTNGTGKYTIAYGHITDNAHTESRSTTLELWKNRKIMATFGDGEAPIVAEMMEDINYPGLLFPEVNTINAMSDKGNLEIVFTTEEYTPILIPLELGGGYRIVWELVGTFEVSGEIDGESIDYSTKGYMEYVGDLLMLPSPVPPTLPTNLGII